MQPKFCCLLRIYIFTRVYLKARWKRAGLGESFLSRYKEVHGKGMGREIALELGRCGAVVVCVDIREDTNQETMRLVQQQRQENIKILGISKKNVCKLNCKNLGND